VGHNTIKGKTEVAALKQSRRKVSDWERASLALKGIEGKRLTYRRSA